MKHISILIVAWTLASVLFKVDILSLHERISTTLRGIDQVVMQWLFHLEEDALLIMLENVCLRVMLLEVFHG